MANAPEKKSPTEPLDVQRRIEESLAGQQPIPDEYPYFAPSYDVRHLHIGTEKQLFLDNFILDHLEGLERVIPKPDRPEAPVLNAQTHPWELTDRIFPAAALQDPDDKKFKIWYVQSLVGEAFGDEGMILCYAESPDCVNWEKPLSDKCLPYNEHAATNIVLEDSGHHISLVLNHDQSDPDRKYLMAYNPHDLAQARGLHYMSTTAASPDALRWTTVSDDSTHRHHHFQRTIWDEAIQKWISYSQYSPHRNFLHRKRQIGRQVSEDFFHWSPKEIVLSVDWDPNIPPNVEFHEMSVRKIGGLYIGIAAEFDSEPIWSSGDGENWRDHAYSTLSLYVSRDGVRWQRASGKEPWVITGRPGSYDHGFVCNTVAGQLNCDGKTYIVYSARREKQHWHGIKRPENRGAEADFASLPAKAFERGERNHRELIEAGGQTRKWDAITISTLILREDGWALLRPTYERGKAITRQFVFEGEELRINADVYGGYIRVEVLDPLFEPYEGFSYEQCEVITSQNADEIWHTVRWRGQSDVSRLWDKPVRLVFHLHHASIYAFQFTESGE
jgi:hypothetical protein